MRPWPHCTVGAAMVAVLFRALLVAALFGAGAPVFAQSARSEHAVDEAPAQLLPASQTRDPIKVERVALAPFLRPRSTFVSHGPLVALERPTLSTPPAQFLRSHVQTPRRRIPRMRDDLGDDP